MRASMKNKTTHYLKVSFILISIFCIVIFTIQTVCMNLMSEDAIRQLGVFYMSGLSEEVASHFGTTIELRLSQVEALVDAVPPGRFTAGTPLQVELTYNARSSGFEYLAFYNADREFQMIYGSQVKASVPKALHRSVQGGRYNVCAGTDAAGSPIVLMGVPAVYPMGGEDTSIALVAGLPISYLRETLEGTLKDNMVEYAILRDDGSYVLKNSSIEENNYFDRVEHLYETYNGKGPWQYIEEFRDALECDRNYTSEIRIDGKRWNVYCTNLPNSEWHLLLKISHGSLDETVNLLQRRWAAISIGGCSLIVLSLLLVFAGYFRLTRRQIYALDEARKSADQARLSAERSNRAKNEFLSNMSHDIRTPMNGIMGMTSIAISSLDNLPRVRSCLKKIDVSSRHLLGLINDMLDMSKIESGKLSLNMEPLSLHEIIENITTIIYPQVQEKCQDLKLYVHTIYYENVCSDRVRLSQILLNILGNAVKFTPEGGTIEVSLREEPSPKGDAYIRSILHVRDNGIGMSEEFQGKIFDAFSREDSGRVDKAAGAGMGMTITKHIVDAMGGAITVESQKGKGSDFCAMLDMEKTMPQEKDLHLTKRDVLVVEDDETARQIAVDSLESIGLCAEPAADASQAVQILEEHLSKGDGTPIILLDWDLQGKDGREIAREMHSRFGSELPILLMADMEWDELEANAEECGISGFILKPMFRSALYYTLRQFTEAQMLQQTEAENEICLEGKRILVAEDNDLNWEIADEMLSEFGMELDWAENGQICVEKLEQSAPGWYDAILMDLRMPVMTGYEATTAIRKSSHPDAQNIPIIAISADAFAEDIQKCLDCGMNAHTAKPFNLQKVLGLLNQYLG